MLLGMLMSMKCSGGSDESKRGGDDDSDSDDGNDGDGAHTQFSQRTFSNEHVAGIIIEFLFTFCR
jgi:hypothetical protein